MMPFFKRLKHVRGLQAALLTLVTGFSFSINADDTSQSDHRWILAKYDLNGDDTITAEEITSKKLRVFQFMDTNQDGAVSVDEYIVSDAQRRETLLKARFDKLDLDHDGIIDGEEYTSYLGLFASIDGDGDGNISESEVKAAQSEIEYKTRCLWVFCLRTQSN
ncbi:EF-hand domain-containing protein [Sessilibacter corallicola]